jgi:hypothetical protein
MYAPDMSTVQIIGRSSSHFTRVALVFAHELGVPFELVPIYDMTEVDPAVYAGNPALKLPTLRRSGVPQSLTVSREEPSVSRPALEDPEILQCGAVNVF